MAQQIDIGAVSAYALAVEKGYTGTEDEFAINQAGAAKYADNAKASETAAALSEKNAATAATKAETFAKRAEDAANSMDGVGVHRYGALWDGEHAEYTRVYNAVGMTAAAHKGAFDPDLKNDFDDIYPWSGMRLCNWEKGSETEMAKIVAFEGEPGYDPEGNLGTYRPGFWYKIEQQENGGILFVIADGKLPGYTYNPPYMLTTCFVGDDGAGGFTSRKGDVQMYNKSLNNFISYAAAQGMMVEDYWANDAEKLLQIVEFATLNTKAVIGNGCTGCRFNTADVALIDEENVNHITVAATVAAYFNTHVGRVCIGIGTSSGGNQIARQRRLTAIEADPADETRARLVFDGEPVNVAAGNVVYTMGSVNDGAPLGSASGYVGANGVAISYYRGAAIQTGAWMWIANILRAENEHIYVAPKDTPQTGVIGDDWCDSGIVLQDAEGWIKSIGVGSGCPLVQLPTAVDGNSSNPVGGYLYRPAVGTGTTALISRGGSSSGDRTGVFTSNYGIFPAAANWGRAAQAIIRDPFNTGGKVETPVKPD